jgi:hypothetical protein
MCAPASTDRAKRKAKSGRSWFAELITPQIAELKTLANLETYSAWLPKQL